jgi:glutathione S-transferase
MWEGLLLENEGAGPYLFGQWSMADCMYLPVATRFRAYGVDMGRHGRAAAYVDALHALPAFQEWRGAALDEALLPHYEL